ncbi:hypothetical protein GCM10020000_72940 [Streptomyces olivoverticillatus]
MRRLSSWDRSVFRFVARHHWPGGDRILPRLPRGADHGVLWFGVAAGAAGARRAVGEGPGGGGRAGGRPGRCPRGVRRRRHGLPLAVLPGGTRNHFAYDLGIESLADACRAVEAGEAVTVDLARLHGDGYFLNTFSIGAWPAGLAAAVRVLRTARPVTLRLGGRERQVWMLFAGNCT